MLSRMVRRAKNIRDGKVPFKQCVAVSKEKKCRIGEWRCAVALVGSALHSLESHSPETGCYTNSNSSSGYYHSFSNEFAYSPYSSMIH